jgi:hypothetical protein
MVPYEYSTCDNGIVFRGFQAKSLAWVKALACLTNGDSLSIARYENHVPHEATITTVPERQDGETTLGLRER